MHLTFSTKHRQPIIDDAIEQELFAYLWGICTNIDCPPIQVGGCLDHVHILCLLSKRIALMKLLEVLKANSSKWIKTKGKMYRNFYWQDGYGAFSVDPADLDALVDYIQNQKEHHRKKTFQEEYRLLLKKYGIDFDERYVWD